jgi:N utilization substance protein B
MPEQQESHKKIRRSRTAAREAVLSALYEIEVAKIEVEEALNDVLSREIYAPEAAHFITSTVRGIYSHLEEIDQRIVPFLAPGWSFSRLAVIDRNVLRMACYELFCTKDIPPKATINEAVNLTRRFSTLESCNFVNGVLGHLLQSSPKSVWEASQSEISYEGEHPEDAEILSGEPDSEVEVIQEGSEEHQKLKKIGQWVLKSEIEE